ncbi:MAG: NADH-quinone oxidoreductase subunit J [Candidatus Zixiibacteriota bacterium]
MNAPTIDWIFFLLSVVILVSAFLVVSLRNIFHCALALVACLFAVAGLFIKLDAEFLAAAQVLVYVGAVAILMIFAVMLTSNLAGRRIRQTNHNVAVAFFVCVMFALGVLMLIGRTQVWRYAKDATQGNNALVLGKLLMTKYVLPFEVVSALLLAALIGAIVLAREEKS